MLRKLLKYDMKSGLRVYGFLWLGIAGLTLLNFLSNRLLNSTEDWQIVVGVMSLFPMVFIMAGAMVLPFIYAAVRFYKGLLGREGYLMFTLPTTPWKLLTSKLLAAIFFSVVTIIVAGLGLSVGLMSFLDSVLEGIPLTPDVFFSEIPISWSVLLVIFGMLAQIVTGILKIYMAFCLGHLFRGKRILWSILIYFGLDTIESMIATFLQVIALVAWEGNAALSDAYSLYLPLYLGLGVLYYFFCERILRNKLNLE